MANPIIKVRCWKCEKTFHLRIWQKDCDDDQSKVTKLVSCPYCRTDCALRLSADQVRRVEVMRETGGVDTVAASDVHALPVDCLAGQIFDTTPLDE